MLQAIVEAHAAAPRPLPALRAAGSGGAMVPPELVRDVTSRFNCAFCIVYGQTECSPLLTMTRPGDAWQDSCETLGQPMPHVELAILDLDDGSVLPLGAVGEICARGYPVMLGYHDDPQATAKAICAQGWLHTGDLGTMDARGYVRITGRVKEMIIRGGENLFPAEIENVLLEHPDVAESRRGRRAGQAAGRGRRRVRAPRARPVDGQEGAGHALPRPDRGAEDPRALDRSDAMAAHRIGQDPEVRAAPPLGGRAQRRHGLSGNAVRGFLALMQVKDACA